MIVSAHQPDFLPFPGFWNKMINADIMDLCIYDPWRKGKGVFSHRVKVGTDTQWEWLTLPVEAHLGQTISEVVLLRDLMSRITKTIERTYRDWPYYDSLRPELLNIIDTPHRHMWTLNLELIMWVVEKLGIRTNIGLSPIGVGETVSERIYSQLFRYNPSIYVSGRYGAKYLDPQVFERCGCHVKFQDWQGPTGYSTVSILSLLFQYGPEKTRELIT